MIADTAIGQQSTAAVLDPQPGGKDEFTRLHITPLDPELLKIVVPAPALPNARNISYHTIETFPEKRYGFVELPRADADKLKAKLNGAVLKGAKMRIEKARPETKIEPSGMADKESRKEKKKSKDKSEGSKKRKREDNVVDGVALTDRKVKRGWTESPAEMTKRKKKEKSDKKSKDKKEKKRTKSKYTEQEECLLKTKLPLNVTNNVPEEDKTHKKKKKKGNSREVTIHEFEKTTKFPSFLKDSGSASSRPSATEFVEGKGWVDEDGNTVEAVTVKKPTTPAKSASKKKPPVVDDDDDETSSSGTSSDEDSEEESEPETVEKKAPIAESDSDDTSSDGSSEDEENLPKSVEYTTPTSIKAKAPAPASSSPQSLKIKIPPPNTPSNDKIHPLEALYKRKKPDDGSTETLAQQQAEPFTFFGADEEEEQPERQSQPMPMTPFTKQDFEWRNVRSAAPTPDTAHPSRMSSLWPSQYDDEDVDEDMDAEDDAANAAGEEEANGDKSTSDFQSWFWENRRELNQSWMKRRKTAAKEKRHRENKARASRAV